MRLDKAVVIRQWPVGIPIAIFLALLVISLEAAGQWVTRPRRVVDCQYPTLARAAHLQGEVKLLVTVAADGTVTRVAKQSGSDVLAEPAIRAVSRWLYEGCATGKMCGAAVTFTFVLAGEPCSGNCPTEFRVDLPDRVLVRATPQRAIVD